MLWPSMWMMLLALAVCLPAAFILAAEEEARVLAPPIWSKDIRQARFGRWQFPSLEIAELPYGKPLKAENEAKNGTPSKARNKARRKSKPSASASPRKRSKPSSASER